MANKTLIILTSILGALIIASIIINLPKEEPEITTDEVKTFSSYSELKEFIKANVETQGFFQGLFEGVQRTMTVGTAEADAVTGAGESKAADYSTTNIQVQGVDEADIVKNDGKYIYVVSGKKVLIIDAFPAELMHTLSEINLSNYAYEIFINDDKLVVFSHDYEAFANVACKMIGGCGGSSQTLVYIYNIEDKENPELEDEILVDGSYIDSRMIGDYIYTISTKHINVNNPQPPIYEVNRVQNQVQAEEIYYLSYPDSSYVFTTIASINLKDADTNVKVYLTGASRTLYVSQDNIFLTYSKTISQKDYAERLANDVAFPLLPNEQDEEVQEILDSSKRDYEKTREIQQLIYDYSLSLTGDEKEEFDEELMEKMQEFQIQIQKEYEKTVIHRINIDKEDINYKGVGEAPGRVLNQFSMDEYKGNFRIATTTGNWRATSLNHLYILNEDLEIIGKVEDLAKGESIYSTRFLRDRAYIVTFKKIDPLFVIDVSEPEDPEVLGYLKITGYSDYLHIYDENHVIGIGKETAGGDESFSWYQGIKISLFDVSDVENPAEKAKIEIGDRGTDSEALREHKAFLFDREKEILVIPITLNEINESRYEGQEIPDNAYGETVWQGAYVLNINLNDISVRGRVSHSENQTCSENYGYRYCYFDYNSQIRRSLYMDDALYTISNSMVKANDLDTIDEISMVNITTEDNYYGDYYGEATI